MYIDKLDDTVNKYNNTYRRTIEMKPVNVNSSTYIDFKFFKIFVESFFHGSKATLLVNLLCLHFTKHNVSFSSSNSLFKKYNNLEFVAKFHF